MKAAGWCVLLLAGCSFGHPDRERLGDVASHDGRWADALADYRAAGDTPRLTAKRADVALQAGLLDESAADWTRLAVDAPERTAEAAAGLARVADAAERDGRQPALAAAIAGLRRVAPGWPLGRIGSRLGSVAAVPAGDAAAVVPAVLAANPGRDAAVPWLLALAQADRAGGACTPAVPILEGVLRRTGDAGVRDSATATLGWCELGLGLAALQAEHPGEAERWFDRASRREPHAAAGRRAVIGLGDARLRQGDTTAARLAWESLVVPGEVPDSLAQLALARLQPATATVPDSGTLHPVRP